MTFELMLKACIRATLFGMPANITIDELIDRLLDQVLNLPEIAEILNRPIKLNTPIVTITTIKPIVTTPEQLKNTECPACVNHRIHILTEWVQYHPKASTGIQTL
jgi:hypothetical protein